MSFGRVWQRLLDKIFFSRVKGWTIAPRARRQS